MLGDSLPTGTVSPANDRRPRSTAAGTTRPDGGPRTDDSGPSTGRAGRSRSGATPQHAGRPTREELAAEVAALQQELEAQEAREQRLIDRYERLLSEERRKRREADSGEDRERLTRLGYDLLRLLGLR